MIINLTQHNATHEQIAAGVREPDAKTKAAIQGLLTFDAIPDATEIQARAEDLAAIAGYADIGGASEEDQNAGVERFATAAMIGGAPYLMAPLESALRNNGIQPVYAFSRRESVEDVQADGSVVKRNVFRHVGFV